jgi:hypothetical protein
MHIRRGQFTLPADPKPYKKLKNSVPDIRQTKTADFLNLLPRQFGSE